MKSPKDFTLAADLMIKIHFGCPTGRSRSGPGRQDAFKVSTYIVYNMSNFYSCGGKGVVPRVKA